MLSGASACDSFQHMTNHFSSVDQPVSQSDLNPLLPLLQPPSALVSSSLSRRAWLSRAALVAAALAGAPALSRLLAQGGRAQFPTAMTVFKSPTCGCCTAWVEHVTKAGFKCTIRDVEDLRVVKQTLGIPAALESCHTAQIGTYLVEGHVPADLIKKLLTEKPAGRGLAVPGMPIGSPGMEGGTPERYQILLFGASGAPRVYATRG